jgi:hypothetical protein
MSEDIGACRRFPLAIAQAAHNTWATARASIVFPSDEKDRAAMVLQRSGPIVFGPASETFQQMVMCERTKRQRNCRAFAGARLIALHAMLTADVRSYLRCSRSS